MPALCYFKKWEQCLDSNAENISTCSILHRFKMNQGPDWSHSESCLGTLSPFISDWYIVKFGKTNISFEFYGFYYFWIQISHCWFLVSYFLNTVVLNSTHHGKCYWKKHLVLKLATCFLLPLQHIGTFKWKWGMVGSLWTFLIVLPANKWKLNKARQFFETPWTFCLFLWNVKGINKFNQWTANRSGYFRVYSIHDEATKFQSKNIFPDAQCFPGEHLQKVKSVKNIQSKFFNPFFSLATMFTQLEGELMKNCICQFNYWLQLKFTSGGFE